MNDITPHSAPPKTTTRLQLPALECPLPLRVDKALGDRINLEISAVRDGLESWQPQLRHVERAGYGLYYGNYYGGL